MRLISAKSGVQVPSCPEIEKGGKAGAELWLTTNFIA